MSDPILPDGTSAAVKPIEVQRSGSISDRIKGLFTRKIVLPGWLLILWGIFTYVPDFARRFNFWVETAKTMSPYLSILVASLTSPYFGISLIFLGIIYLVFVGQPKKGVLRHPVWPILTWIATLLIFALMLGTAAYGAFEIEVRRLGNLRADEILAQRATGGNGSGIAGSPSQTLIPAAQARYFRPDQIRNLIIELNKIKAEVPILYMSSTQGDGEASTYMNPFYSILPRAGIQPAYSSQLPANLDQTGLYICIRDLNNVPDAANKLMQALEVSDVHARFALLPANLAETTNFVFTLYFAPNPL